MFEFQKIEARFEAYDGQYLYLGDTRLKDLKEVEVVWEDGSITTHGVEVETTEKKIKEMGASIPFHVETGYLLVIHNSTVLRVSALGVRVRVKPPPKPRIGPPVKYKIGVMPGKIYDHELPADSTIQDALDAYILEHGGAPWELNKREIRVSGEHMAKEEAPKWKLHPGTAIIITQQIKGFGPPKAVVDTGLCYFSVWDCDGKVTVISDKVRRFKTIKETIERSMYAHFLKGCGGDCHEITVDNIPIHELQNQPVDDGVTINVYIKGKKNGKQL